MAEGVAVTGGKVVAGPVFDDKNRKPDPDLVNAPLGWTWDRSQTKWRPTKKRGNYARGKVAEPPADKAPVSEPGTPERVERDPDPAWFRADEKAKHRQTINDVPKAVQNDIAGFAGLIGAPLLAMLATADPYCGTALAQNFEPIVDAALPLICRSEKIVAYFSGDKSDWLLWAKLAMALRPVATAVLQHHVLKTVVVVRDSAGVPQFLPRQPEADFGEHLQPDAQPEPDLTEYAA